MPLILADRVKDTTTTTGTGTITLSGTAPIGYVSFGTAIGNGNTTYYTITAGSEWEVGIGTYTASGTTLSRDTVLASSAGGTTKVTFSAGTKDVFVTYPAGKAISDGYGTLPAANGGTGLTSPGTAGNVLTSNGTAWTSAAGGPAFQAVASGTLADGSTVIVNTDGTVSVAGIVVFSSPTFGTATVFESANTTYISATYDSVSQKVVIAYRDVANSNYGTAIVGTVSGTSISFGTAVVFESAATIDISATYDSNAQRVVIAYQDSGNSNYGTAIVGTVSGTSISFGTAVVFRSAATFYSSATYHSVSQKVVIAYRDNGNSAFGTAIVGTVSGTSISFGTATVFESAATLDISATYDSVSQKVVIAYQDVGNSSFGTAIVGTVSGTSISFGTATVFESASTAYISATYDSNAQRVVIAYQDVGNSSFGTAIVGTVSGTSISFGTVVVFESATTPYISATYDSVSQKVVIAYQDAGNSSFGTAIVGTVKGTNLTAENFIGFSNGAYTNGQTATVQVVGAVDDAQTGLTPGQSYFVQTTGALGLTADSPSVFAGTAVAASKIIVKG
jgi:hypothetical protein